jgi:hypothetical protein
MGDRLIAMAEASINVHKRQIACDQGDSKGLTMRFESVYTSEFSGPFLVKVNVFVGATKTNTLYAPWVPDFDTAGGHDVVVLSRPLGALPPGLFAFDGRRWNLFVSYPVLAELCPLGTAVFDLLFEQGAAYTPPEGARVYQNGIEQPSGTLPNNQPGWATVSLGAPPMGTGLTLTGTLTTQTAIPDNVSATFEVRIVGLTLASVPKLGYTHSLPNGVVLSGEVRQDEFVTLTLTNNSGQVLPAGTQITVNAQP